MDKINDKWGEFVITPALMRDMDDITDPNSKILLTRPLLTVASSA
jgi:hypothetical protein